MSSDGQKPTLWTPANIVTVTRILLVPAFVVAILSPWPQWFPNWPEAALLQPWVAAALFMVLACTDALDGYLARSRGEVTDFGKFVDPLADKILVAAALLALVEMQVLPSWVALIIIVREFIVSGLRMVASAAGIVIAASWYGKVKTVLQIIAILLFIIKDSAFIVSLGDQFFQVLYFVSWIVMIAALIMTIVSMVDYFAKCSSVLGFDTKGKKAAKSVARTTDNVALASMVVKKATELDVKLSTAESCTGGLISGALTAIPGSSAAVLGGIVSYANEVKEGSLGVDPETLQKLGAVSSEVAQQMAEGSRKALGSDIAVSVTGIAGPDGGTEEKPVGTVWFGISSERGTSSNVMHFDGSRDQVREQTVNHALSMLLDELEARSN